MSLVGLAIIGKRNQPLYMCDCTQIATSRSTTNNDENEGGDNDNDENNETSDINNNTNDVGEDGDGDPFGFREIQKRNGPKDSLSMEVRFMIHSSLDRMEEMLETTSVGLPVPLGRSGAWLGPLQAIERYTVYGYITATRIKFLLVVDVPSSGNSASNSSNGTHHHHPNNNHVVVKESIVRGLLGTLHEHYITYMMNPFSNIKDPVIDNPKFDQLVADEIRNYTSNLQDQVHNIQLQSGLVGR